MRLTIVAIGRQKGGPEAKLVDDYMSRAETAGRSIGLGPVRLHEIEDRRRRGMAEEARLALAAAPDGAWMVALDERGRTMSSPDLARTIGRRRDDGARDACFMIGGPDGHGDAVRARADMTLSFGPMVWPHLLVRAMLAEQLYRAVSILAGAPYHRN